MGWGSKREDDDDRFLEGMSDFNRDNYDYGDQPEDRDSKKILLKCAIPSCDTVREIEFLIDGVCIKCTEEGKVVCHDCKKEMDKNLLVDGLCAYCNLKQEHLNRGETQCDSCKQFTLISKMYNNLCGECYKNNYIHCSNCNKITHVYYLKSCNGTMHEHYIGTESIWYCLICYGEINNIKCSNSLCSSYYDKQNTDGKFCYWCKDNTNKCSSKKCKNRVHKSHYSSYDRIPGNAFRSYDGMCEPCYKKLSPFSKIIRSVFK